MMRRLVLVAVAALLAPAALHAQADPGAAAIAAAEAKTVPLTIHTGHGVRRFAVEVARTDEQQQLGLMYRRHMGAQHGMIFPSIAPKMETFWMRNTYLPLDLLFIRQDGTVSSIAANATPLSDAIIPSTEPVMAVLELNAGAARRFGIKPGDRVRW